MLACSEGSSRRPLRQCTYHPGILYPAQMGGSPPHLRDRANGDFQMARGSKSDGYANSWRFWVILAKPPNEAILDLRDPQHRTRDQDSVPKGPRISSYGPFSSHLVKISSQIKPNPAHSTWGNLGMDFGEPGHGFWLLHQWRTLDFQGSKKAPEMSFLDS